MNISRFKHSEQRFSIQFEARIPSGRKNHFCTPCLAPFDVLFFVLSPLTPILAKVPKTRNWVGKI